MTWPTKYPSERIDLGATGRIDQQDALRQRDTAIEILRRLEGRPGLVLADEVGMGKTFVALAVAASVAWGDKGRNPVVVMVPPSLRAKWPSDFVTFRDSCVGARAGHSKDDLTCASADSGVEFLKLMDDPRGRRKNIVFVTHGALSRGLSDPWTKLAIFQSALHHRALVEQRRVFHRFAAEILRLKSSLSSEALYEELLKTSPKEWDEVMREHSVETSDDPVPRAIIKVLEREKLDLRELRAALKAMPIRDSSNRAMRIRELRRTIGDVLPMVWAAALSEASFHSPLLILDEAHHLKNPATRLASLFVEDEAMQEANLLQGVLARKFERMLFLTATPFQLGHNELMNVLDRFRGIRWQNDSPSMSSEQFEASMTDLREALDEAQGAALRFERAWSRIRPENVERVDGSSEVTAGWWLKVSGDGGGETGDMSEVTRQFRQTTEAMRAAEEKLRPWVIRHLRPRKLPNSQEPRRRTSPGAGILDDSLVDGAGLPVQGSSLLPFLLVARGQAIIAGVPSAALRRRVSSTTFVEGLSSSFEAYTDTRSMADAPAAQDAICDEIPDEPLDAVPVRLQRYLRKLDESLPSALEKHPKISATIEKAKALWKQGEKVLIFCHFRATARALGTHLSRAIQEDLRAQAIQKIGCSRAALERELKNIGRAFDAGRPASVELERRIDELTLNHSALTLEERHAIRSVVRRFVRTDSFIIRYFPLNVEDHVERLRAALAQRDASNLTLEERIESFVRFIANRTPEERTPFLDALKSIRTGARGGDDDGDESGESDGHFELPLVRVANGLTDRNTRQRLMLAFNAPFMPEILIASSVLAEGVDLHLDCRHVIHHDLDWNPSTLEQRTGRVDRIGAKAERASKSIRVYLPYVAGTQDEKMYRVVRDRERWFQVVMGEAFRLDEFHTDRIAERVPLPAAAAKALGFRLGVWSAEEDERS